jgi:hypothetical protein
VDVYLFRYEHNDPIVCHFMAAGAPDALIFVLAATNLIVAGSK